MKKKKTKTILILGMVLIGAFYFIGHSCKKDPMIIQNNKNKNEQVSGVIPITEDSLILGKWQWKFTIRIWQQDTLTSSIVGYMREMIVHHDTIYFYKNNSNDAICTYSLSYLKYPVTGNNYDSILSITFNPEPLVNEKGKRIGVLTLDSLVFDDRMVDGNIVVYSKK